MSAGTLAPAADRAHQADTVRVVRQPRHPVLATGQAAAPTRYGFLSTYPPTQCGLATFTAALRTALVGAGGQSRVVRSVECPQPPRPAGSEVVGELVAGDPRGPAKAAALLNGCDIAVVQHEYGIYGGRDGVEVLAVLRALTVPSVVVLHTVLTAPTPHQRSVLEAVVAGADAVVTMTTAARDRLAAGYDTDLGKVSVIPHGAPQMHVNSAPGGPAGGRTVLTWGLIGPGKGIEWGIEAMAALRDLDPAPRYVVAGQTHPKVLLHEGEAYRDRLREQVRRRGLEAQVSLDSRYRDAPALAELVRSADVVLLPYDSTDQVTSGVLIEAVAAQVPVVATRFPHAVELLGGGAGLLVAHRDPTAMAAALRLVLTRTDLAAGMSRAAATAAPGLLWPAVAERYRRLAAGLTSGSRAA